MPEQSQDQEPITREKMLADLKAQGITSLEDLVDGIIPEVGGFMLSKGSLSGTWETKSTFTGGWYVYIHDDEG